MSEWIKRVLSSFRRRVVVLWLEVVQRGGYQYNRGCNLLLIRIAKFRISTAFLLTKAAAGVSNVLITLLVSISGVVVLCLPSSRLVLENFDSTETVLTSLGATFGTILALVLTLSIIPIQRAGEAWSPSIVRLYRRDSVTHFIFIALGFFCAAGFSLSIKNISGVPGSFILVGSVIALGISLDLLRWYHRHICLLLDPSHAVGTVTKYARKAISQIQHTVSKAAKLQYKSLTAEQQSEMMPNDLEAAIFPLVRDYPNSINYWIDDLGEIASKGTMRGEKFLANTAINGIREIVTHYLAIRKDNLIFYPAADAFLVTESDVKVVVNQAYEILQDISRSAVASGDESTAIRISEAYAGIAIYSENIDSDRIRSNSSSLTSAPISYLLNCVKYAQEKDLDEVPFQSAQILSRISLGAPNDIVSTDVHIPVLDGIHDITIKFYTARKYTLAEQMIKYPMMILNKLSDSNDYYFHDLLRHELDILEALTPLAVANEALQGRLSMTYPLNKAYGLTNPNSLGYLFAKQSRLIVVDENSPWINPYHEVVEILDLYQRHFRNVGENIEFGDSFLLWELTHLIKHISIVVDQMIYEPLREKHNDEHDLVDKLQWVMSFFWVAFDKKKTINVRWADDAGDVLAFVSILFFERGYCEVLDSNISHLRSIIESYCKIVKIVDMYALGDLFAHLWCLKIFADARTNEALSEKVNDAINTKPSNLTDDQWQRAQETIELRRTQLIDRLEKRDRGIGRDTAENLLRRVLAGTDI